MIVVLILIGGIFYLYRASQEPTQNFKVDYYAEYSSSAGDRMLSITYSVREGVIVSCEGTYSFPPSSEQMSAGMFENNVEQCNIQKLENNEYNVPLELITSISEDQKRSDEVRDGSSMYKYQIRVE